MALSIAQCSSKRFWSITFSGDYSEEESRNKHKIEIAKAYCNQKLADFKCEERRRVRPTTS